jgi:cardiolipin synthase
VSKQTTHEQGAHLIGVASAWRRVQIYFDGDLFFRALEEAVASATRTISLESYIFATDRLGYRVLDALTGAARRGVQVRIIVDGIGSSTWVSKLRSEAVARGLELKVFHELPWERWWRGKTAGKRRVTIRRLLFRVNNRNHRKVCIIDGARAFVGSMNVIEYHLAAYVGAAAWRDAGVQVEGGEVPILEQSFNELWQKPRVAIRLAKKRRRVASSGALIKLNTRRVQRRENYLDLLVRLVGAQRRIWISNAYFVPDGSLLRALSAAAEAGVDVKILVPATSDVVFIPWVTAAFHDGLLRAGVQIFEYTKTMLHAKTMLVDDWGLVGSSNLNHRSLLHDLEADVVLADEDACRLLQDQFVQDCNDARQVTLENWRLRPWIERAIGRLLLAVRRVL